jgi:hypothetical protein
VVSEGATHSGFDLFYLVQNPNDVAVDVHVKYLLPSGAPIDNDYVVDARSRFNVWVNTDPRLRDTDVSAVITTSLPTTVERAMYLSSPGTLFSAGHESAAVTAPATQWFLAEGATGPFFDLYVLVANAGDADAEVEAKYLLPDGAEVKKPYTIAAGRRRSIHVDGEDAKLANTAVSTTVPSLNDVPIVVERAKWWPDGGWYEGHSSAGATATGTAWAAARNADTQILVANTSETTGT